MLSVLYAARQVSWAAISALRLPPCAQLNGPLAMPFWSEVVSDLFGDLFVHFTLLRVYKDHGDNVSINHERKGTHG